MTPSPIATETDTAVAAKPASPRRVRLLARFRRSQDGATAVEFAFIAFPFLLLLTAIMETALMFWTSQVLEEAVSQTSRKLLTGESQTRYVGDKAQNTTKFREDVCAAATAMVDCSKLTIDVRTYSSFAGAKTGVDASNPIAGGGLNTTGFGYSQPQPSQIVVVRAVLEYSLYFTQWSSSLANIGNGRRGIVASATFRTEPFNVPAT